MSGRSIFLCTFEVVFFLQIGGFLISGRSDAGEILADEAKNACNSACLLT
jgi:hypothetical protein